MKASPGSAGRKTDPRAGSVHYPKSSPYQAWTSSGEWLNSIEALVHKIEDARTLKEQTDLQIGSMCRSILVDSKYGPTKLTPMREIVRLRSPDVEVRKEETYHFAGVYCFGRGVFRGQHKTGMETSYRQLTRLQMNNFLYPKLMAWEGAFAIVPAECDGLVVSTEFPVFEIDQSTVLPEVLESISGVRRFGHNSRVSVPEQTLGGEDSTLRTS